MSLFTVFRSTFSFFVLLACSLTVGTIAQAQITRAFVSASGSDNRLCDRGNPCRAIQSAVSAVANGGEVSLLSSGEYEPFIIDKSVRIIAPEGVQATVVAKSGNAISVNIAASDAVLIRGLSLHGSKTAIHGIQVNSTAATGVLHVENCDITNFKSDGIGFAATSGHLYVVGTTSRNNTQNGIRVRGLVHVLVDRCRVLENELSGMDIQMGARATIRDSIASGNAAGGDIETGDFNSLDGVLSIENCVASNNANGIRAEGGVVQVSNTMITDNAVGVLPVAGGQIGSFGNNRLRANGLSGNFTLVVGQR